MSAIYFHSQNEGDARVSGSERAMMSGYINKLFVGLMDLDRMDGRKIFDAIISPDHYMKKYSHIEEWRYLRQFETAISVDSMAGNLFTYRAKPLDLWLCKLNTAIMIGSEVIQFCVRMHAQCEIHAYVEGANREWLAQVIERGLEQKILRSKLRGFDQGWSKVIALLRNSDKDPIVTSYSVCDSFPNATAADYVEPDDEEDTFHDLPKKKQWELGLAGIRARSGLEIKPDCNQYFGDQLVTVFDLLEYAYELQPQEKY
jgi:hypothetical protein